MIHSFEVEYANKYGLNCAIILQNIISWSAENLANGIHIYDGYVWVCNSIKAWQLLFPYLSEKQIRMALDRLEELEVIRSGYYNENPCDRSKWYALNDVMLLPNYLKKDSPLETSEEAKALEAKLEALDDGVKTKAKALEAKALEALEVETLEVEIVEPVTRKRNFTKPTIEEVAEYIKIKGYSTDPEEFFSFYESKDWFIGKNKMKDWRMALVTWEKRNSNYKRATSNFKDQMYQLRAMDMDIRARLEKHGVYESDVVEGRIQVENVGWIKVPRSHRGGSEILFYWTNKISEREVKCLGNN